ncbi:MAG: DUF47 domain-containing protein [Armatimonadetes bacterium]|nr:DUF47 domain-containing protein [Armatimonadota bacterium]
MFRFIPRQDKFFDMLERAADNVVAGAIALKAMIADFAGVEEKAKAVKEIEHEGDIISHEIFDSLNKTFITPFDREDIYALASALDDILDAIERVSNRMLIYRINTIQTPAQEMVSILVSCTQQVKATIGCLRDISQTTRILDHCIEIDRLENEADDKLHTALELLFANSNDALEVIKWKEIYETIERATDICEDASDVIEALVVKGT